VTPANARYLVGPVPFTVMTLQQAINTVAQSAADIKEVGHPGLAVHFCNAYNVALASNEVAYASLLAKGDLVFSDGVPITWVGKAAHPQKSGTWERVYGPDVMTAILEKPSQGALRHYLLGGSPETLLALSESIRRRFPNAVIVGQESPPFRAPTATELEERDARITESKANLVWVGLGTPKQDFEVARLAASVPAVAMAVGAAFDFLAGTVTQAPVWVQRSGFEWAYRLAQEPKRLSHRYLWGNSVFLVQAAKTVKKSRAAKKS
jgi:N-acetylglucosaminyldiphosphoundecaprenol N-acetyl-beta-D-mannosaminyltransferase